MSNVLVYSQFFLSVMERKYVRLVPPGDVFDLLHFDLVDFFFCFKKQKDDYQLSIIDYNLRKHYADPDISNFTVSSPGISTHPQANITSVV